jgi:Na+/H+ antiporter NhaD/arsenite permease-like protein
MSCVWYPNHELCHYTDGVTLHTEGDPPNLIVASAFTEIGFADFLGGMLPAVVIMFMPCVWYLKWAYKGKLSGKLDRYDKATAIVSEYKITNPVLLVQTCFCLGAVILALLTHDLHHVDHSWLALLGCIALMIASEPQDIEHAIQAIEWETLLYFAGLFVMVEGMTELGLIRAIGEGMIAAVKSADPESQEMVACIIMLWVSAIVSSLLDNTAYTATMVSVVRQMTNPTTSGLDATLRLKPLAWALCFGACLGGNASLNGASANMIVAGIVQRHGARFQTESCTRGCHWFAHLLA